MRDGCHFIDTCPDNKNGKCTKKDEICWLKENGHFVDDINNGERIWVKIKEL
jgi:hypothetical protein